MTSALFQIKRKKKKEGRGDPHNRGVGSLLVAGDDDLLSPPLPSFFFFIQNFTFLIVIFK
jgi:hypothetical protein